MPVKIIDTNGDGTVSEKLYEKVSERLERFRKDCSIQDGWGIKLDVRFPDKNRVLAEASIVDPEKRTVANGHAEKVRGASEFTESMVEWTSTTAIGRALGAAGYGTGEISTADEILLELRQKQQEEGNDRESTKPIMESSSDPTGSQPKTDSKTKTGRKKGNGSKDKVIGSASRGGSGGGPQVDPEIIKVLDQMGLVPFDSPQITYAVENGNLVLGGKVMPFGAKLSKVGFIWEPMTKSFVKSIGSH